MFWFRFQQPVGSRAVLAKQNWQKRSLEEAGPLLDGAAQKAYWPWPAAAFAQVKSCLGNLAPSGRTHFHELAGSDLEGTVHAHAYTLE
jgi:hypothetical protein